MKAPILLIAMFALLAGCSSTSQSWESELVVTEQRTGPAGSTATVERGWLEVQVSEPVRETRTPSERLILTHEYHESVVDWGQVGLSILYGLGIVALGVLYVVAWWSLLWLDYQY